MATKGTSNGIFFRNISPAFIDSLNPAHYIFVVFLICLATHGYSASHGWFNTLLDMHGFRQTQTAMSVYYILKGGAWLDYITPVMGPPWAIPFEFPTYQLTVAALVKVLGSPIEQTGRAVNLMFFYATLVPVFILLGHLIKSTSQRLLVISFILVNPVYIFWSRTFLIESTALFFTACGLLFFVEAILLRNRLLSLIAALLSTVAGLTKATTLIAHLPLYLMLFIFAWQRSPFFSQAKPRAIITYIAPMLVAPIAVLAWTSHTDAIKSENFFANEALTSEALKLWNFGTLKQRVDPSVWHEHILNYANLVYFPFGAIGKLPIITLILPLTLFFNKHRRQEIIVCAGCFFFAPIVFTNLYFVHNYYAYANSILLSVLYGFWVISLIEMRFRPAYPYIYFLTVPIMLFVLFDSYQTKYLLAQQWNKGFDPNLLRTIQEKSRENDVILVYGSDWNPSLCYYAQRKCLMDKDNLPLEAPKVRASLTMLKEQNLRIAGMIVAYGFPEAFSKERAEYFNLQNLPSYDDGMRLFYAAKEQ